MLKGISPIISPELLKALYMMGHGDEIVFCDAHFPAHSTNCNVIRADGLTVSQLLEAVIPLFELDQYVDKPVAMMDLVGSDRDNTEVIKVYDEVTKEYKNILFGNECCNDKLEKMERFSFYERSKKAFAVVATSDTRQYSNVILKKGVIKP